jgi:hypothetical protein
MLTHQCVRMYVLCAHGCLPPCIQMYLLCAKTVDTYIHPYLPPYGALTVHSSIPSRESNWGVNSRVTTSFPLNHDPKPQDQKSKVKRQKPFSNCSAMHETDQATEHTADQASPKVFV